LISADLEKSAKPTPAGQLAGVGFVFSHLATISHTGGVKWFLKAISSRPPINTTNQTAS
jgi:hypothetical protein